MDPMITGALMAQMHINEINEPVEPGELWEPKASWLQRFGAVVFGRNRTAVHEAQETPYSLAEPCPEPCP